MGYHKESCRCSAHSLSINNKGRLTLECFLIFTQRITVRLDIWHIDYLQHFFRVGVCFDFVITNFAYICGEKNWNKFRATSEIVLIPCPNPFNDVLKMKAKQQHKQQVLKCLKEIQPKDILIWYFHWGKMEKYIRSLCFLTLNHFVSTTAKNFVCRIKHFSS